MLFAGDGVRCVVIVVMLLEFSLKDSIVLDCSDHKRSRNLAHSGFNDDTIDCVWVDNQSGLCNSESVSWETGHACIFNTSFLCFCCRVVLCWWALTRTPV